MCYLCSVLGVVACQELFLIVTLLRDPGTQASPLPHHYSTTRLVFKLSSGGVGTLEHGRGKSVTMVPKGKKEKEEEKDDAC